MPAAWQSFPARAAPWTPFHAGVSHEAQPSSRPRRRRWASRVWCQRAPPPRPRRTSAVSASVAANCTITTTAGRVRHLRSARRQRDGPARRHGRRDRHLHQGLGSDDRPRHSGRNASGTTPPDAGRRRRLPRPTSCTRPRGYSDGVGNDGDARVTAQRRAEQEPADVHRLRPRPGRPGCRDRQRTATPSWRRSTSRRVGAGALITGRVADHGRRRA